METESKSDERTRVSWGRESPRGFRALPHSSGQALPHLPEGSFVHRPPAGSLHTRPGLCGLSSLAGQLPGGRARKREAGINRADGASPPVSHQVGRHTGGRTRR